MHQGVSVHVWPTNPCDIAPRKENSKPHILYTQTSWGTYAENDSVKIVLENIGLNSWPTNLCDKTSRKEYSNPYLTHTHTPVVCHVCRVWVLLSPGGCGVMAGLPGGCGRGNIMYHSGGYF